MLPERHGCAYRALDRGARPGHLRAAVQGSAPPPCKGPRDERGASPVCHRRSSPALDRIPFLPRSRCRCNHAPWPGLSGCPAWTLHLPRIRRSRPQRVCTPPYRAERRRDGRGFVAGRDPRSRRTAYRRAAALSRCRARQEAHSADRGRFEPKPLGSWSGCGDWRGRGGRRPVDREPELGIKRREEAARSRPIVSTRAHQGRGSPPWCAPHVTAGRGSGPPSRPASTRSPSACMRPHPRGTNRRQRRDLGLEGRIPLPCRRDRSCSAENPGSARTPRIPSRRHVTDARRVTLRVAGVRQSAALAIVTADRLRLAWINRLRLPCILVPRGADLIEASKRLPDNSICRTFHSRPPSRLLLHTARPLLLPSSLPTSSRSCRPFRLPCGFRLWVLRQSHMLLAHGYSYAISFGCPYLYSYFHRHVHGRTCHPDYPSFMDCTAAASA